MVKKRRRFTSTIQQVAGNPFSIDGVGVFSNNDKEESKFGILLKGIFMLFGVWLTWYAVIGSVIGPLNDALWTPASKFPQFMGWYPATSMVINYAPVIATIAIIIWMLWKGTGNATQISY